MKRGLVLGKFMPFHTGHAALINFALTWCDELIILICAAEDEPIAGAIRLKWIEDTYQSETGVKPRLLVYDENILPNTSESSREVSLLWANYISQNLPVINLVFSSELYGQYLAGFLGCDYKLFDKNRTSIPVSATQIRNDPFKRWDYLPAAVKPFYVKKICLYGTESTGKTTLTKRLGNFFNTVYVPEMAREILEKTDECEPHHLQKIAELHAKTINEKIKSANKLLFADTDVNITKSYSRFLFNKELSVPGWISEANKFDLYLFLDNDAPYIQDGTRLSEAERNKLHIAHKKMLTEHGIKYVMLQGSWDEKFEKAIAIINNYIHQLE